MYPRALKGTPEASATIASRVCCYWARSTLHAHVNGGKAVALAYRPRSARRPCRASRSRVTRALTTPCGSACGAGEDASDVAAKINKDVNAALASADLRDRLTKLGTVPGNLTIPQFTEFVKKEIEETSKILQAAGIKPQ
jgi:hypothetical protein